VTGPTGSGKSSTLAAIIERKQQEIRDAGQAFWGYGGTLCHPLNQVQPFAQKVCGKSGSLSLLMWAVDSPFDSKAKEATHYSATKKAEDWDKIPKGIKVTGSSHALVLTDITAVEIELDLSRYVVGVGPKEGTPAVDYIRHRTDKGCLSLGPAPTRAAQRSLVRVSYVAKLAPPYAVFVKRY
ncbi:MAG: hypothetical protein ABI743_05340, partial [bacterium]